MGTIDDLLGAGEKTLSRNREMRGIAGAGVKGWPKRCEVATTGIQSIITPIVFCRGESICTNSLNIIDTY